MSRGPRKTAARRHRKNPDAAAQRVGARVRELRQAADFSFDAFVEETGLGRGYISELERGLVVPTIHALNQLARALGVTTADLLLGDSTREQLFDVARGLGERDVQRLLGEARSIAARRIK